MPLLETAPSPRIDVDLDDFDPDRALEHTEALAYPRRVGTARERQAARYILRQFAALGFERKREAFPVPLVGSEIGRKLTFVACAGLVLAGASLAMGHPLVAAIAWLLAARAVNSPWRMTRALGGLSGSRTTSQNLLARRPGPTTRPHARVVFMAHYDTKSQTLPTGLRVGLVIATTWICGLLALLGLIAELGAPALLAAARPAGLAWVVIGLLAALAVNRIGDRSPGVIDNGSGVGTLLELARTWRPRPGAPVEAVWVATGSEEIGLEGARHALDLHAHWWRETPTLLINLESVGAGDRVFLAGEPEAVLLAEQVADRLAIPRARLRILGAGMDHQPFAARGLAALSLMGDVVRTSFAFHTDRDDLGLLERPALGRAGQLAAHLAWAWADRHRPGRLDDVHVERVKALATT